MSDVVQQPVERGESRSSVVFASSCLELRRILNLNANVCVWRRELATSLETLLEQHSEPVLGSLSGVATGEAIQSLVQGLPAGQARDALEDDITQLIDAYVAIADCSEVVVSLQTVSSDRCRKFHADYKPLRLVCTYLGPGTEWACDTQVNRAHLGCANDCVESSNDQIVPNELAVQRARAGDVVFLKGELYPNNLGHGAVHRSPTIAHLGRRRLVLTIDAQPAGEA